jgi:hypothetical protein
MAFGILMLADKIIGFLGYPAEFYNSVPPMILLALHVPLAGIDMVIGTVLATSGKQRAWAFTGVAAAVLNPAANLVAIPLTQSMFGNGSIGAALITTVTELFMLGVGLRLLPAGIVMPSTLRYIARCVVAGIIMSIAVWFVRDMPIAVPVAVGAIAYAAMSFALRTLTVREVRAVAVEIVGRRLATRLAQGRGIAA